MRKFIDNQYFKISLYIIFVIAASILTYRLSSRTDNIMPAISSFFAAIFRILSPILYGLLIAYFMNPAMSFFERHLTSFIKPQKLKYRKAIRSLSIFLVYIVLFGSLIAIVKFLFPKILENIKILVSNFPTYLNELQTLSNEIELMIEKNVATLPFAVDTNILFETFNTDYLFNFFSVTSMRNLANTIISNAVGVTGLVLNLVIGFVVALYALTQKESFVSGAKRLTYASFKEATANKIINLFAETHIMVTKFFVGKSLDSLIIGILCYLGMHFILKNPYALLLSLIIGVCNMIPYFGPFIGAVPAVIITLFEGVTPAIGVIIFILVIQQLDGLVIGPKILGDSIGISPFWIISAITIGGALWGPLGMFFASPLLAVLIVVIERWVDKELLKKAIPMPKVHPDETIPIIKKSTTAIKWPTLNKKPSK